jgi:hypothetical protein
MGDKRNAYRILVGRQGDRQLGRPRRRWMENIIIDLRDIEWNGMDWIDLAQDREKWRALVNTAMNLRVTKNAGKFLSGCTIGGFPRSARLHKQVSIFFYSYWGETESLVTAATTGLLYQPQMIGDGDCEEIGGMKIGRGNGSTQIKPAPR